MNKYSSNRHVEQMLVLASEAMAALYAQQMWKSMTQVDITALKQESRDNFDSLIQALKAEVWAEGLAAGYDLAEGEGSWIQVLTYETAHLFDNPYEKEAN